LQILDQLDAFKWDAAKRQQFCSSRDFDSKKSSGVCQVVSGFSLLGDFPGVSAAKESLGRKMASGNNMRTELLPPVRHAAFAKSK
jgi:hypothetical protein